MIKLKSLRNSVNLQNYRRNLVKRKNEIRENQSKIQIDSQALDTLPYFDDNEQLDQLIEIYQDKVNFDSAVKTNLFNSLENGKYSYKTHNTLPSSDEVISYLLGYEIAPVNKQISPKQAIIRGTPVVKSHIKSSKSDNKFILSKTATGFDDSQIEIKHKLGRLK